MWGSEVIGVAVDTFSLRYMYSHVYIKKKIYIFFKMPLILLIIFVYIDITTFPYSCTGLLLPFCNVWIAVSCVCIRIKVIHLYL